VPTSEGAEIIEQHLLDEIPVFENFLHNIGFKRNEGAIYGLLVLSEKPLSSEEIEKTLNLSQSAVSQALKKLTHFGAVETRESRESGKRVKEHFAKEDSLAIVSTVFRKREQETIEEFKKMASRLLEREGQKNNPSNPRIRRLQSILSTCEIAESVIHFVMSLTHMGKGPLYDEVVQNLPKALQLITQGTENVSGMAQTMATQLAKKGPELLAKKLKTNFLKLAEAKVTDSNYKEVRHD
jgi:DNA-binding transcriptional regulator GbsR (MarR family)